MDQSFESDFDFIFDEDYEFRRNLIDFIDENALDLGLTGDFINWGQDFQFLNDLQNLDKFNLEDDLYGGFAFALKPKINERFNQKWQSTEKTCEFSLKNIEFKNFFEASTQIKLFFEQIFNEFISPIKADNLVRVVMNHDSFNKAINTPFMQRKEMTSGMFLEFFSESFQSRTSTLERERQINHKFSVSVITLPKYIVKGGNQPPKRGRPCANPVRNKRICKEKKEIIDMNDFIESSRFVINVTNNDNFCLIRAFFIGKAFSDKDKNAKNLNRKNNRKLNNLVCEFVKKMDIPDQHLDLRYCKLLEDYFENYQITVYDTVENNSEILYPLKERLLELKNKNFTNFISIVFHNNNHFNLILSPNSYFGNSYFCEICRHKYSNLYKNNCPHVCVSCRRASYKCKEEFSKKCKKCNVLSKNDYCQKLHNSTICKSLFKCTDCGFSRNRHGGHVCKENEKWCPNCNLAVDNKHKCFIKKDSFKKQKIVRGKVFFDIESYENEFGYHQANLIMAKRFCKSCEANKPILCDLCNKKYEFTDIKNFVKWILKKENKDFIFISHNGKSYDNYFIMRYLQKNKLAKETNLSAVTDGQKILTFKFRSRIFKDSSLFIARPLESFTKTFGLGQLKKGFFSHTFNRPENFNYIGPHPSAESYKPEFFSQAKKAEFEKWHLDSKDKEFDFNKEIREYCWSDVSLLAEGCIKFSEMNKEASKMNEADVGIDPLEANLTISSFCNKLFRKKYMKKDSIAWVPANGYDPKQKTSLEAITWLKYISEKENIYIQHARNGKEKAIGKYFVDGFSEEAKKIFEYQG